MAAVFAAACPLRAQEAPPLNDQLNRAFAAGELAGLHAVYVKHRGETLAEAYFDGSDERWGEPLGNRLLGPDDLHDLRSVTKSIVGLLYGIALAEGKVPPVDAPLMAQFPQYPDLAADPERAKITVADALSMTMGTAWNEDVPYTSSENSEVAMEMADDRYRFVLDRPMVTAPGETWTYNGGATAIIGVGEPIDTYAESHLFRPLGITEFEWIAGADGVPSAASGLRLSLRDLVKIGELVLAGGQVDGKQVVPKAWLEASFAPHAKTSQGLRYGYFWWLASWGDPPAWAAGFGNGGQRLTVQAGHDLIVAVLAGNYNQPDAWKIPVKIIEGFVVPAVQARTK